MNNKEVQRYEWSVSGGMYPVTSGDYVKYSDYLLLKSRIEDLEDTISDLRYEERFRDTRD